MEFLFSWLLAFVFIGAGAFCLWIYFNGSTNPLFLIPSGIGILILLYIYIRRARQWYVVTNRKVEIQTGLVVKSSNEIRVKDIRSINVTKHGLPGLIGIGSVEFSSAATDRAEVIFVNIGHADRVRDLVTNLQESWLILNRAKRTCFREHDRESRERSRLNINRADEKEACCRVACGKRLSSVQI